MRRSLEQLGKPGTSEYETNHAIRALHQQIGEHIPTLLGGLFTKGISGGVKIGGEIALETSEIFNGMLEESQDPSLKRALVEGGISVGSNKYFYHTIKATLKAKAPWMNDTIADTIAQSGADYMHGWFRERIKGDTERQK